MRAYGECPSIDMNDQGHRLHGLRHDEVECQRPVAQRLRHDGIAVPNRPIAELRTRRGLGGQLLSQGCPASRLCHHVSIEARSCRSTDYGVSDGYTPLWLLVTCPTSRLGWF